VKTSILVRLAPLLLAPLLWGRSADAHHKIELDLTAGYRGFGGVDIIESEAVNGDGRVSFDGSFVWGPIVGYRVRRDAFIFLNYTRQDTTARFTPKDSALSTLAGGLSIDSFQFGGNVEKTMGRFVPYLGVTVGVARLAPRGRAARDEWNFSAAFDGGVKLDISKWLHLRLLARLPFSFYGGQSSTLCLTSDNCLVKLDGEPSLQAEILGGIGVSFL
jgi:hypothetical protein